MSKKNGKFLGDRNEWLKKQLPPVEHPQGAAVTLSEEEVKNLRLKETEIVKAAAKAGLKLEEVAKALGVKMDVLDELMVAREAYTTAVMETGRQHSINLEGAEKWNFNQDTATFTRTA